MERCQRARSCNVRSVSSTGISLEAVLLSVRSGPEARAEPVLMTAYSAPASKAFRAYSFPSKFSPLRAKNSSPPVIFLLSVATPLQFLNIVYSSCIVMAVFCWVYLPVLPKPPSPRSVSSRVSVSSHCTCSWRATTICAIRSPGLIVNGWSDRLIRMTLISPR